MRSLFTIAVAGLLGCVAPTYHDPTTDVYSSDVSSSMCADFGGECEDLHPVTSNDAACPTAVPRRMVAWDKSGNMWSCTTFPSNGYWITAAHCVQGAVGVRLEMGVKTHDMYLVAEGGWSGQDRRKDWAVLWSEVELYGFTYDPSPALPGDKLDVWGFPDGKYLARRRGRVTHVGDSVATVRAVTVPGDSGGPAGRGCYFKGITTNVKPFLGENPLSAGYAGVTIMTSDTYEEVVW